jgi:D-alanine---D-serine ligase
VELAYEYDDDIIVEENIDGFEVGCAILGNEELTVGQLDEIELASGFFNFHEKYTLETSAIHVPARIPAQKAADIKDTAKTIYKALGCSGFARVDMFLTPAGKVYFSEVNTIPGFTAHSRYPNMLKAIGMSFEQIIDMAVGLAINK